MRLEIEGNTATIYGLSPESIGAETMGAAAAVRDEVLALSQQQIIYLLNQEELPLAIQNALNNILRSGVQFILGNDAPGDTYFRSASGPLARLGIGANGKTLQVVNGLPAWGDQVSLNWAEVTTATQVTSINSGYIVNNATLATITLPATAPLGSIIEVVGKGAGGWRLAQSAGQTVYFGNISSTSGVPGQLNSTHQRDAIRLVNVVANTDWQVVGSQGNIDVI